MMDNRDIGRDDERVNKRCHILLGVTAVVAVVLIGFVWWWLDNAESIFLSRRIRTAERCIELDPKVRDWIDLAVIGRVRFLSCGGRNEDDLGNGLSAHNCEFATLEITRLDGCVVTNEYVVESQRYYENGIVSNFHSRAIKLVSELVPGMKEDAIMQMWVNRAGGK